MKLTIENMKIHSRNKQIAIKLEEKFGSLENFAKVIEMSGITVYQYLKQNREYTDPFKAELTKHLGDYNSLAKSPQEQITEYIDILTRDIYDYKQESDIKVLRKAVQMADEHNLAESKAKANRNIGKHYMLMGQYSVSLTFYEMALSEAQQIEDINIECMIISEMISLYTYMNQRREGEKLFLKYESRFEAAEPYRKYWYYYYVAVLYIADRNYSYARPILEKALFNSTTDYTKLMCLNLFGFSNKEEKNYDIAIAYYNQSLELAEQEADKISCYNNIADLYSAMGNKPLAEENIEKAMSYIGLGTAYEHLRVYQTYAEIKGTDESIIQLLGALENLVKSKQFYPAYVLESIAFLVNGGVRLERVESIIIKYIVSSEENTNFTDNLYKYLGVIRFMEVNNHGKG